MKVGPISGDLVVKLALTAAVVGALYYAATRLQASLPSAQQVKDALDPTSDKNLAYTGVNALGNAVVDTAPTANGRNADGSWTLGGWAYDLLHGGQVQP